MSDDLERRLHEAGHRLPGPTELETEGARSRILSSRRRPRLLPVLSAAVLAACAFGVGYAVASGGTVKSKVIVKHVPARLDAGPGFLPASGWKVDGNDSAATATSPQIYVWATFVPASRKPALPQRLLPLQLPPGGRVRHVHAHVGAYAVDVTIGFASPQPSAGEIAAARAELGRLVVPSCPAAQPIAARPIAAANYVLEWLPAHYSGSDGDLAGARATAALGRAMPRYGEATADCGARVAGRSVEVDVTLPRVAKVSASLSELTFFVARTSGGWAVWERAR